jgi:hypothetical protein
MAAPAMHLIASGAMDPPEPGGAGPFSMAERSELEGHLAGAGFSDVRIDPIKFAQEYESFDQYWEITIDLAGPIAGVLSALDEEDVVKLREAVRGTLAQFEVDGGRLSIPATAVGASARA